MIARINAPHFWNWNPKYGYMAIYILLDVLGCKSPRVRGVRSIGAFCLPTCPSTQPTRTAPRLGRIRCPPVSSGSQGLSFQIIVWLNSHGEPPIFIHVSHDFFVTHLTHNRWTLSNTSGDTSRYAPPFSSFLSPWPPSWPRSPPDPNWSRVNRANLHQTEPDRPDARQMEPERQWKTLRPLATRPPQWPANANRSGISIEKVDFLIKNGDFP